MGEDVGAGCFESERDRGGAFRGVGAAGRYCGGFEGDVWEGWGGGGGGQREEWVCGSGGEAEVVRGEYGGGGGRQIGGRLR